MSIPRNRWLLTLALTVGLTGAAATQTPTATRRTPQFDNESVRVWKSVIAPGQPLSLHRHENGRVIVALVGGTLEIVKESGESRSVSWETGKGLLAARRSPRGEARRPEPGPGADRGDGDRARTSNALRAGAPVRGARARPWAAGHPPGPAVEPSRQWR
jgi:hypothetical protein